MAGPRYPSPERLQGILKLSKDPDLDADEIVRALYRIPEVRELANEIQHKDGPDRQGDPLRMALHMVASGEASIENHHKEAHNDQWRLAGWPGNPGRGKTPNRPCKSLYYKRLGELASPEVIDRIWATVAKIVAIVRKKYPMFAQYLMGDGTAVDAHVDFRHDCDEGCCPNKGKKRLGAKPVGRGPSSMAEDDDYSEDLPDGREDVPTDEPPPDLIGELYEFKGERLEIQKKSDGRMRVRVIRRRKGKDVPSCWYVTRCKDAWIRIYTHKDGSVKRMWIGYIQQGFNDVLTGALIYAKTYSARRNESSTFMESYEGLEKVAGRPKAITYDMALDVTSIYKEMTCRDVALVVPLKADPHAPPEGRNFLEFDCEGGGRCPDCFMAGSRLRFSATGDGGPRVWFRCSSCEKDFSLNCSRNWRLLTPLSRLSPVFHELLVARGNSEGPHADRRERWGVAGNDVSSRSRKIGTEWHDLQAALVSLIEVSLVAFRSGALKIEGVNLKRVRAKRSDYKKSGREKLQAVLDRRESVKLHLPWGVGIPTPPSAPPESQRAGP
jgi:hypothetical protein